MNLTRVPLQRVQTPWMKPSSWTEIASLAAAGAAAAGTETSARIEIVEHQKQQA